MPVTAPPPTTVHFSGKRDALSSNPEISTAHVLILGMRDEAARFPEFCTAARVGTRLFHGRSGRDPTRAWRVGVGTPAASAERLA
jgi:hypothetical protein